MYILVTNSPCLSADDSCKYNSINNSWIFRRVTKGNCVKGIELFISGMTFTGAKKEEVL